MKSTKRKVIVQEIKILITNMPFKSKAQERFAYATHQPWASEWASKTNQKSLPKRVKRKKK